MANEQNNFQLLRDRYILSILDGDVKFGEIPTDSIMGSVRVSLPYLSGPNICAIATKFGLHIEYGGTEGTKSRWAYLDDLLVHCIKNNKISDLLNFLFSKGQFAEHLKGYTPDFIESAYQTIVTTVIRQINGALYFDGYELVQINSKFVVKKIDEIITVATPALKMIDRTYMADLSKRAMQDVTAGNFDSAITKSRTLVEEVFCYAIEKKGEVPSESGDIGKLYSQVKSLYKMHQDKDMDRRINGLLSGLEKILSAIAEMRNKGSDSHGVGTKRINIAEHHARLFVNSAMTIADFILSVSNNQT